MRLVIKLAGALLDDPETVASIARQGSRARHLPDADAIVAAIAPELRAGDVVALLSNGGFGGIYDKLPQRLRERAESGDRRAASGPEIS